MYLITFLLLGFAIKLQDQIVAAYFLIETSENLINYLSICYDLTKYKYLEKNPLMN